MNARELKRQIDVASDTPLYRQIADQIRQHVASGHLAPGDPLPTVRGLAEELDCNPSTVSRAYAELRRDSVITGRRGAGTHVARRPGPTNEAVRRARLVNLVERSLLETLSAGYTPAEVEAAFTLALSRWRELREGDAAPQAAEEVHPNQLRFVGSHDPAVELLATQFGRRAPTVDLSVTFAGSLAGLIALARGEAEVAGTHLRDEQTGEYNVSYVRHILPGRPVELITVVTRSVGLIVPAGNPKEIDGIADLARHDVKLVNRQAGSGTRVLLDARLQELGIEPSQVNGYTREVTTHTAVATAIADGDADVGLGIRTVAQAYTLDFIPLLRERYELVILEEVKERAPVRSLLGVLRSKAFRTAVEALGGYDVSEMGRTIHVG